MNHHTMHVMPPDVFEVLYNYLPFCVVRMFENKMSNCREKGVTYVRAYILQTKSYHFRFSYLFLCNKISQDDIT